MAPSPLFSACVYGLALTSGVAFAHYTDIGRFKPAVFTTKDPSALASSEPMVPPTEVSDLGANEDDEDITPVVRAPDGSGSRFANGRIITGSTPHKLILFTFDDGPDLRTTPQLLDQLDAHGVKAVFFVTTSRFNGRGRRHAEQAELAREIVQRGHIIGNHTVLHSQLPTLTSTEVIQEIERAQEHIEDVTGVRPWLFRPPGGSHSPRVDRLLAARGYTQMLWNLGTGDFQVQSPEEVFRIFRRRLAVLSRSGDNGGVVLLHDTHRWSVEAFPRIMSHLKKKNCELLERGEELYDVVDDPALFFEPRIGDDQLADASTVAAPARPAEEVLQARQDRLRERETLRCGALASL